jgi:DNA-binding transcriptional LysR family regulator
VQKETTSVELKHLQALLGIAETGSFSAAAESIGTVQSNISAHVARLEKELDVVLVDRSSGRLTEEGEIVAGRARRMMGELDAMVTDVVALRREVAGTVRAGMIGTTGRWLLPQLFDRLSERHPDVHLNVTDGTNTTLELQLTSGKLEVALVTLPLASDELTTSPLFEEDIMLVVPNDHPLVAEAMMTSIPLPATVSAGAGSTGVATALRPTISTLGHELDADPNTGRPLMAPLPLTKLANLELLLPAPGTSLRDEIDAVMRPTGIELRPSMELDGLRMIASLTFDGYGPALLPATAVPGHVRDRFCSIPLEGLPRRRVGIAMRTRGVPSAPARALIAVLHDVVEDRLSMPEGIHPAHRD